MYCCVFFFFFQAEDGIRDAQESRGLGDVYKRQQVALPAKEGQMCVLDFHQPFAARLMNGSIVFNNKKIEVKDGIAYMRSNNLTVFVQT